MFKKLTRFKYPLALVIALLCAVSAIYLTKHYFDERERQLRENIRLESQLTDIVVAKRDLSPGDPVSLETMTIKSIPFEFVPDGSITPDQYSAVENKFLSDSISAGKPLLRHFIEGVSRVERFSDLLAFGERAITLEVDSVDSIEHMLEAGDYIDLGVKYKKGKQFQLLLDNIRVLSTGNLTVADPKFAGLYKSAQYSTITLGVNSRDVQDIFEADNNGELVFLLRNEKDQLGPLYNQHTKSLVAIYAGSEAKNGVMQAKQEQVDSSLSLAAQSHIIRNSKGRMHKIAASDSSTNNKITSEGVVNEVVSND